MRITNDLSDRTLMEELGSRIARSRLDRNMTRVQLAHEAGVSAKTVFRVEGGGSVQFSLVVRILRALRFLENFELLVPEPPVVGPIEQMDLVRKRRRRASGKPPMRKKQHPWKWGDEE